MTTLEGEPWTWLDAAVLITVVIVPIVAFLVAGVGQWVRSIHTPRLIVRLRRRFLPRQPEQGLLMTSWPVGDEPRFHFDIETPSAGSLQRLVVLCVKVRVTCRSRPGSVTNFRGWVENEFGHRQNLERCEDWSAVRMPDEKRVNRDDFIVTKSSHLEVDQSVEGHWFGTLSRSFWDGSRALSLQLQCESSGDGQPLVSTSRPSSVDKPADLQPVYVETAREGENSSSNSVRSSLLKLVCLPVKDLAGELGVPYSTVRNWSSGRTEFVPEKHHDALAELVRSQAKRLEAVAEELEGHGR